MATQEPAPEPAKHRKSGRQTTAIEAAERVRAAVVALKFYRYQSQQTKYLKEKFGVSRQQALLYLKKAIKLAIAEAVREPLQQLAEQVDFLRAAMKDVRLPMRDRLKAQGQLFAMKLHGVEQAETEHKGRVEELLKENPELIEDARRWEPPGLTVVEPNVAEGAR